MMPMKVAIPTRIVATTTCTLSHPSNIVPRDASWPSTTSKAIFSSPAAAMVVITWPTKEITLLARSLVKNPALSICTAPVVGSTVVFGVVSKIAPAMNCPRRLNTMLMAPTISAPIRNGTARSW